MPAVTIPTAVCSVVANYTRMAGGWLGADELQQVAAVTMLEAARTWKPGGAPLENYQAKAVAFRLKRYIAKMRRPASAREDMATAEDALPPQAEWHIDLKRAAEEVQRILSRQSRAAVAVLLEERAPAEVAAELGLSAARVYTEAQAARRALRGSRKLRALAEAVL